MLIGKKVKELREKRGLTLSELSKQSGIQIATLSRIENMKMTGTLESHIKIAKTLGIDITQLYQDVSIIEKEANISPSPDRETFSYNDKASYEILTTNLLSKKMMPVVLKIEPHGATNPEQGAFGAERFVFVLEGEITAQVGEKTYPLPAHKALYFDASLKHFFRNPGTKTAKLISIMTPVVL
ncbi:MAG: XRE family transcriptional regulator [Candidatus Omnitrophota bacterium]|nr:XRE family transcriptional regulator [Candidatus Omnitrophota bacterium]